MSFTWFAKAPLRSREQIAVEVHKVSVDRGLDVFATILTCMAVEIEVGADPHDKGFNEWWCPSNPAQIETMAMQNDSHSNDSRSCGYLQQQEGPNHELWWGTPEDEMDLSKSANTFQDRLTDKYMDAVGNPNLAGQFIQNVQGSRFPDRYQHAWDVAHDVVNRALATAPAPVVLAPSPTTAPDHPLRPDFNEFALWSPNNQSRGNTAIDLWLWHTEQGHYNDDNAAMDLSGFIDDAASQVSYHYGGSMNMQDKGVTIIDWVNTDRASWSVLSANNRSIDFVVAGSDAGWSRDEWMRHAKVLDAGCYICAQDCIKYPSLLFNGQPRIIAPDANNNNLYHLAPPGISDHKYVTKFLKDGSHSDCGPNFPWDYITARTMYWFGVLKGTAVVLNPPTGGTVVAGTPPDYAKLGFEQLAGPAKGDNLFPGWEQLEGRTIVNSLALAHTKLDKLQASLDEATAPEPK